MVQPEGRKLWDTLQQGPGTRNFTGGPAATGERKKRVDLDWIQGRHFYNEAGETREQVTQKSDGYPIPERIQTRALNNLV